MAHGETSRTEPANIDELESSVARKLAYYRSLCKDHDQRRKLCMIFKVQEHTKQVDKLSYEPMVLSIGPYYSGSSSLLFMERIKWNCLDYILKLNCGQKLENYLVVMEGLEKQARSCYSEDVLLESDMFLRMLLLDGCFILVYLSGTVGLDGCSDEENPRGSNYHGREMNEHTSEQQPEIMEHTVHIGRSPEGMGLGAGTSNSGSMEGVELTNLGNQTKDNEDANQSNCDPIYEWHHSYVFRDLFLLENQLPFFVVKRIYELLAGADAPDLLAEKICKYVEYNIQKYTRVGHEFDGQKDFHHLLQLCHMYFRPQQPMQQKEHHTARKKWLHPLSILQHSYFKISHSEDTSLNQQISCAKSYQVLKRWRRAEQYHEAGIEFRRKEYDDNNPHSLLDIFFDKGEVEIPCLPIDENTACLFRNLVAFEQTCPRFGNDFTAYIAFISQLVSTPSDVALLARRGIILHHMRSDDEVSTLFSKLGKNVDFDPNGVYYLQFVCQMMEEYYQNRVNRWMAWLWHKHFNNPWMVLAVVAAAVVLICTIVQSLLALLAYLDQMANTNDAATNKSG
ncbi:hypothetical protein ACP70R_041050 [Stipagrostis hirtigluma subsp. patula]